MKKIVIISALIGCGAILYVYHPGSLDEMAETSETLIEQTTQAASDVAGTIQQMGD